MIPRTEKGLIIFLLLLSAIFLAPFSPVNAGSPTVTQKQTAACASNVVLCQTSGTFTATSTSDIFIVGVQYTPQNANEGPGSVSSVTTTIPSTTFSLVKAHTSCYSSCAMAGNFIDTEIWTAQIGSLTAGSVTANYATTAGPNTIEVIEVTTIGTSASCTVVGDGGTVSANAGNTATSCTSSTDGLAVGGPIMATCLTISGGAGYTTYPNSGSLCGVMLYGSIAGSTNYPYTISAGGSTWGDVGAFFASPVTTFTVVACTFFQLQCWWYPILMFGCFAGIFTMVGAVGKASQKGITYLLLTGLTYCSLLEVMMGMITVMMPVVLTGLTLLYAARTR